MATPVASRTSKPGATIVIASLMLFSMFFGAGNLIFPPMVGVSAGTNFWPAVLGFLAAGVLLPVLAIVAVSISGRSVRDLSSNGGALFGLVFSVMAYLAIGAFYALPRTGAVSMETAITPLLGWEGTMANGIFNVVFFLIALALSWKPNSIIDTLGNSSPRLWWRCWLSSSPWQLSTIPAIPRPLPRTMLLPPWSPAFLRAITPWMPLRAWPFPS